MSAILTNFAKSDSGAVTVDWVVLTAAIVGLGLAVMALMSDGIEDLSDDINDGMANMQLQDGFVADTGLVTNLGAAD